MPILDSNSIFYTAFEPKQANRFVIYVDGIPSFMIKGVSPITVESSEVVLNHINVQRYVKGKTKWNDITMTLFDPITPSGAQSVIEWLRLSHESVTGRDGYSDFYKKDLTMDVIGPVGDVVSEWVIKGAWPKSIDWGEYDYDNDGSAVNIKLVIRPDYCILNY